jgi:hypothetical protein
MARIETRDRIRQAPSYHLLERYGAISLRYQQDKHPRKDQHRAGVYSLATPRFADRLHRGILLRSRDLLSLPRRMTEDRLDVHRTFVLFLAEQTPSFIGVKEVLHSPIHRAA